MRTADPGEATLTLKNPKLDGSSLAKRRKTKLEPVGKTDGGKNEESNEAPDGKGALRVVSEDSGVDLREQEAASTDKCEKDAGKDTETIWSTKEENVKNVDDLKDFENIRKNKEEMAVSQDSVESRGSSDSGQDFT